MLAFDPAFAAHLAGGATTVCRCWRLLLLDGSVWGYTDHDRDVVVAGTPHLARSGLDAGAAEAELGLPPGSGEVLGALTDESICESDIASGRYDGARVETRLVNWADPAQAALIDVSTIGEVSRSEYGFKAELRGLTHALDQERGRLYRAQCSADLGDSRCRAPVPAGAGSVLSIDGPTRLLVSMADAPDGWFTDGALTFSSGPNAGRRCAVRAHHIGSDGVSVTLWTVPARPVGAGDAFSITPGCDKRWSTCVGKFRNGDNFRGFPQMPGNDTILAVPSAGDPSLDGGSLLS